MIRGILIAVALGVAAGGYWWLQQRPSPPPEPVADTAAPEAPAADETVELAPAETPPAASPKRPAEPDSRKTEPKPATPAVREPAPQAPGQVTRTSLAQMGALAMELSQTITPSNAADFEARSRTGDGEAAYALFHKLMACANAPETEEALMGRIEDIYQGSQDNPNQDQMLDQLSEHYVQRYADCDGFPRGPDAMLAAFDWLQASLDLRFPPAMTAYVTFGKSIIQQTALRAPERVMMYRDRVLAELEMLLATGLPDAFVAHAREYASGDLLEQDWFKSYAYAHAAGLSDPNERGGEALLKQAERHLTPPEIRDARELARELCERYCRD